jgi:aspartyl-tRNA(Asn)/glutamyl-tRNA(Gln) amidotransferase subunit A
MSQVPGPGSVRSPESIRDTAGRLRDGSLTAVELVEASLAAIDRNQPRTNAFIHIDADKARAAARQADADLEAGRDKGLLHGIPISLKDLIDVAGEVTSAASHVLDDRIPTADAPVVTRLREAGAVLVGKTNLHQFALGTTSEDSAFGAVHHPADHSRSAGGSSGGSAAAVACGMGLASIGTDTGGSIRIPAAACGVVGLKPTVGEVPTEGVIPLSTSLDHAGPLARTVDDAAVIWAALTGRSASDLRRPNGQAFKLARLRGYFDSPVEPAVRTAFDRALNALRKSGVTITDVELPSAKSITEAYVNVVLPEGAAWHAKYLATRGNGYLPMVRARFEAGKEVRAIAYVEARNFCLRLRAEVEQLFDSAGVDALVLPTLPIIAPLLGADMITIDPAVGDQTNVRAAMLKHTQPFNMSGHPAISIPIKSDGLPVGMQLVGRFGQTVELLSLAAECEKRLG